MIFVLLVSILALSPASVWCGNSECKDLASKQCAIYRRRIPDFCTGMFKDFAEEKCKKTCRLCKDNDAQQSLHIRQTDSEINKLKNQYYELNARLTIMEKTQSKIIERFFDMTMKQNDLTKKLNKKFSEMWKKDNALTKEFNNLKEKFASQAKKHGELAEIVSYHHTKVKCLYGWTFHDGLCYKLFLETKKFWDADNSCQDQGPGGHLAAIPNQSTHYFIVKDLMGRKKKLTRSVWFGMYKSKGVWKTMTGAKVGWFNWARGEPKNHDKAKLWKKKDWKWDDYKGSYYGHYVCQMDPVV